MTTELNHTPFILVPDTYDIPSHEFLKRFHAVYDQISLTWKESDVNKWFIMWILFSDMFLPIRCSTVKTVPSNMLNKNITVGPCHGQ